MGNLKCPLQNIFVGGLKKLQTFPLLFLKGPRGETITAYSSPIRGGEGRGGELNTEKLLRFHLNPSNGRVIFTSFDSAFSLLTVVKLLILCGKAPVKTGVR